MHWRRQWQPTPVFLPGESQGRGSLVGCRLWGRTESDRTAATLQQQQQHKGLKKDMSVPSLYWGPLTWEPTGDIVPPGFVRLSLKGVIPSQAQDRLVYLLP